MAGVYAVRARVVLCAPRRWRSCERGQRSRALQGKPEHSGIFYRLCVLGPVAKNVCFRFQQLWAARRSRANRRPCAPAHGRVDRRNTRRNMALSVTAAPELLDFVATGDNDEQEVAIGLLAELASSAYGQDGVMLGEIVRDTGGVVSTAAVDCTLFLVCTALSMYMPRAPITCACACNMCMHMCMCMCMCMHMSCTCTCVCACACACTCHVHTGAPIAAARHRLGADQVRHAAAAGQSML